MGRSTLRRAHSGLCVRQHLARVLIALLVLPPGTPIGASTISLRRHSGAKPAGFQPASAGDGPPGEPSRRAPARRRCRPLRAPRPAGRRSPPGATRSPRRPGGSSGLRTIDSSMSACGSTWGHPAEVARASGSPSTRTSPTTRPATGRASTTHSSTPRTFTCAGSDRGAATVGCT